MQVKLTEGLECFLKYRRANIKNAIKEQPSTLSFVVFDL